MKIRQEMYINEALVNKYWWA